MTDELERMQSLPNDGSIPAFGWRDQGKPQKVSAGITSALAKLRTEHLINAGLELYLCDSLAWLFAVVLCDFINGFEAKIKNMEMLICHLI
jgi:hypothetical protein